MAFFHTHQPLDLYRAPCRRDRRLAVEPPHGRSAPARPAVAESPRRGVTPSAPAPLRSGNPSPRRALSAADCATALSLTPSPPRGKKPASAFHRRRHSLSGVPSSPANLVSPPRHPSAEKATLNTSTRVAYNEYVAASSRVLQRPADAAASLPSRPGEAMVLGPRSTTTLATSFQSTRVSGGSNPASPQSSKAAISSSSSSSSNCSNCTASPLPHTPSNSPPASPQFPRPCTDPPASSVPHRPSNNLPASPPSPVGCGSVGSKASRSSRRVAAWKPVKPCLSEPCSPRQGSPVRSPRRVKFFKYVEVLEYIP
ncbi:hypothetical protein CLOM_g12997 [Closterium sp. NIES-68]|nr:hypothetical protein CLOM_g12997 [Closterium sp. NIES-68]GJP72142.1 hypothetical protein CLOP_g2898 [Closterium sp. NIES-67]